MVLAQVQCPKGISLGIMGLPSSHSDGYQCYCQMMVGSLEWRNHCSLFLPFGGILTLDQVNLSFLSCSVRHFVTAKGQGTDGASLVCQGVQLCCSAAPRA